MLLSALREPPSSVRIAQGQRFGYGALLCFNRATRFGESPTIADAFFTPVATRFRTYGVSLDAAAQRYAEVLLANPGFRRWDALAEEEPFTLPDTDARLHCWLTSRVTPV